MASFLDTAIPKFNPYIQQLPVEAMVQVGMEKQRRYDEGVQRIQSQISSVAGLDIMQPVQKQYLQSKINELGNNLKTVAAGDFSNFQLVNSVGGMINQVGRDPIIQNAVVSTKKAREQLSIMNKAIQEGKSSPENEDWLNSEIEKWLSSNNVSSSFNGRYIAYKDVDKKLRELGEKVKELDNTVEIPYRRDNAGNVILGKDGKPMVDDAILQIKTKSKSAQVLLNNFKDGLDEGDKQQLMITANYHYRNTSVDGFRKDIMDNYNDEKENLQNYVTELTASLSTNSKLTPAQRAVVEANIKAAQNKINSGVLEKERDSNLSRIASDKDLLNYRYAIYTSKHLNNLAKNMSYESKEYEYKTNPYAQMDMERKKLNLQADHYRQQSRQWYMSYQQKEKEIAINASKNRKAPIITSPDALPTGTAKGDHLGKLNSEVKGYTDAIDVLKSEEGRRVFSEVQDPDKKGANGKTNLENAIDEVVSSYLKDPNPNAPYIEDNAKRTFLERIRALEMQKTLKNDLYVRSEKHVKRYDDDVNKLLEGQKGFRVATNTGGVYYSPKDLFYLMEDFDARRNVQPGYGPSKPGDKPRAASLSFDRTGFLKRYEGTKLAPVANAIAKWNSGEPLTQFEETIVEGARQISLKNRDGVGEIARQKVVAQDDYIAKRMPEVQSYTGALNTEDKETMASISALVGVKKYEYDQLGALNVKRKADFDPATLDKFVSGDGSKATSYTLTKNYDGSGKLTLNNAGQKQVIPLTRKELVDYFPEAADTSGNMITNIKAAILGSENFTTNSTGTDNPVNSYFSGYNIPGIQETALASMVRMDIKGATSNVGDDSDLFEVLMYVNTSDGWKKSVLNKKGYVNSAGLQMIINNIGTATVEDVIKYGR
jgi:hypothetical protein